MALLAVYIYRFFKRFRPVFYAVLLLTSGFFAYFATKINFEEDISMLLPAVKENGVEKFAFSNLKVKDKVFILFNPKSAEITPDDLVEACDSFTAALVERDSAQAVIGSIFSQIDDEVLQNGIAFLYEHAPVFLDDGKYAKIDSLLDDSVLEEQMAENYAALTSAAGSAFMDVVTRDPVGLRKIFMAGGISGIGGSGFGGNYKLYSNHVFTPDTAVAVAFLAPNFKTLDSKLSAKLVDLLKQESAKFMHDNPDIEILFHGAPVQSVSNAERIKKDLALTIAISLILIFVLLTVCFKNFSTLFYLLVPVVYGTLFALAMMYFIKGSMSIMALGIGAIVLGVAFSYCLHVICHYKYVSEPEQVLKDQTAPVILCSSTTIGAFLGLMLTGSELLHDFGLFASLGMLGTTVFALLFLPQFFKPDSRKSKKAFALIEKINSYPFEKNRILIIFIITVSIVAWFASGDVKFDSNLRHIGYNNDHLLRSQDLLASKTAENQATFYFAAAAGDLDSALICSHALSRKLDTLVATGEIKGYSAPSAMFIPAAEQQKRIDRWNSYWNDDKKASVHSKITSAAAKYRFAETTFAPFFDMLDAEYEPVSLYDADILPDGILSNIIERAGDRYLVFTPVMMDKEQLWDTGAKFENDGNFLILDPMYYASDMVKSVHSDFSTTLAISSLFVLIALLLAFGKPVITILAFLPMFLSWYIVLGCMAVFGIEFNLINIVISSFIFGLGVDYSIFIMDGLLAQYRTRRALLVYHKSAIFFSAVILIVVIVSLLFAVHPAIRSIGVATLTGMGATILIAYSLQPFLFTLLISGRAAKGKAPVSITGLFLGNGSPRRKIISNYMYKGRTVENLLRKDLKTTNGYALLSEIMTDKTSMLDFGCGYGFTSYWAAIGNSKIRIVACDNDPDTLAIAENCHSRTEQMSFTSTFPATDAMYGFVIINKTPDEEILTKLLRQTGLIIMRNTVNCNLNGFKECEKDGVFTVYARIP